MVPRGGIEPPTLRFSVACSTNWATWALREHKSTPERAVYSEVGPLCPGDRKSVV